MNLSLLTGLPFFLPSALRGVSVHISFTFSRTMLQWRSLEFHCQYPKLPSGATPIYKNVQGLDPREQLAVVSTRHDNLRVVPNSVGENAQRATGKLGFVFQLLVVNRAVLGGRSVHPPEDLEAAVTRKGPESTGSARDGVYKPHCGWMAIKGVILTT